MTRSGFILAVVSILVWPCVAAFAQTNLVVNGSFESALSNWSWGQVNEAGASGTCSYNAAAAPGAETLTGTPGFPATDGTEIVLGSVQSTSGAGSRTSCTLYQDIAIPAGANQVRLSFDLGAKARVDGCLNTGAFVGLYTTASVPSIGTASIGGATTSICRSSDDATLVTYQATKNVAAYAGTTVRLAFINAANVNGHEVIGIDNVQLIVVGPTVTGVSPSSGPTAGGTSVVITGTDLTGATAVKFGGTNASSYTVNSATQITAISPPGSAGTVDITVTTAGGSSAIGASDQFTYIVTYNYYFLYVFRAGTGSGKVTGSGIDCGSDCTECYPECQQVDLIATPDSDSIFSGWSGDCSGTEMTTAVRMCSTQFCTATFMLRPYTITASARTGGSISPSGSVTVTHGGNQTFTIIPENNYLIFNVKVDGVSVGAVPGYTFTYVTANHTIEAEFKAKESGIFASPSPVDFGGVVVGTQSRRNIILSNTGDMEITITSVSLGRMSPLVSSTGFLESGEGGGFSMGDGCRGKTLSPSRGCIIGVTFLPEGGGAKNAWITQRTVPPPLLISPSLAEE
jgi:hypothetical protein